MKIERIMTGEPASCTSEDHLAAAATKMWSEDCGILPVVDDGVLAGVVTDRDIAMAVAMKGVAPSGVKVGEVASGRIFSCAPDDDVAAALLAMREHKVRRLPVVDHGRLVGLVSLNDIVLEAAPVAGDDQRPTYAEIIDTLRAIGEHRKLPALV